MAPAAMDILREAFEAYARGNNTTNLVFKLHYVVSFLLTVMFIASTTVHLYKDSYVKCVAPDGDSDENVNKYAYYLSTYTTEEKDGLGSGEVTRSVHNYYLWVPFLFCYQLIFFRMTYYIWNKTGGLVLLKIEDLKARSDHNFMRLLKMYVTNRMKYQLNGEWITQLILVEFLNILVCLHQWFSTDFILKGNFSGLGLHSEAADEIFPVRAKFNFTTYGPSGSFQLKDYLCILGLNTLFKVIFIVYWYWLIFLFAMTIANFAYRLALSRFYQHEWLWVIYSSGCPLKKTYRGWLQSMNYYDWLFLQYLRRTLSLKQNKSLILYLAKKSGAESYVSSCETDEEQDMNFVELNDNEERWEREYSQMLTSSIHRETDHPQRQPLVDPQISDDGYEPNIMTVPVLMEKPPLDAQTSDDRHKENILAIPVIKKIGPQKNEPLLDAQTSGGVNEVNIQTGPSPLEIIPPRNESLFQAQSSGGGYETIDDLSKRERVVLNFQNRSANHHSEC